MVTSDGLGNVFNHLKPKQKKYLPFFSYRHFKRCLDKNDENELSSSFSQNGGSSYWNTWYQ